MQALENSRLLYFDQMEELYWTHMGLEMCVSRVSGNPFRLWEAVQQWKAISLVEVMSKAVDTSEEVEFLTGPSSSDQTGTNEETVEGLEILVDQISTAQVIGEDDIFAMAKIAEQHLDDKGHVIFVDWARYYDVLFVTAFNGTTSALRKRVVEYDYWKIEKWAKDNLGVESLQQGKILRKRLMRAQLLEELQPILAPIEGFVKPGDLVVFCPAGILHALPLHAIPFGPEGKPLIVNNPVIYSASNTLLWKCVSRASQFQTDSLVDIKAAAITRLGPNDPVEEKRMENVAISAMQYFGNNSTITAGRAATRARFLDSARKANVLHYHGHAYLEASERKNRALVLEKEQEHDPNNPSLLDVDVDDGHLTTTDIFGLNLDSALVVLLACASGEDDIAPNDDPLGLLSAFLYAGATSVIATLWPTQTEDAGVFAEKFYTHAFGSSAAAGVAVATATRNPSSSPSSSSSSGSSSSSSSNDKQNPSIFLAKAVQMAVKEMWEEWDEDEPYHWAQFELRKSFFFFFFSFLFFFLPSPLFFFFRPFFPFFSFFLRKSGRSSSVPSPAKSNKVRVVSLPTHWHLFIYRSIHLPIRSI